MKEKFFERGHYLMQTNLVLTDIKKRFGIDAFMFARRMLLAAWYAGTKQDTDYISYGNVLYRTKNILRTKCTFDDIKRINNCDGIKGLFFGVPRYIIHNGNINDVIIQSQKYCNTPSEELEYLDEDI